MSVRTITAPGVEIKEIDKSQYTPAMTGTKVYVTGFANSGEDYTPMQFTSRNAWLNYYGEPDNEAERYFYNACMEVINQNGVLYAAKLPYQNAARDKFVGMKYKVAKTTDEIKAISGIFDETTVTSTKFSDLIGYAPSYRADFVTYFKDTYSVTESHDKNLLNQFANGTSAFSTFSSLAIYGTKEGEDDRTDGADVESTDTFLSFYAENAETTESDFRKTLSKAQIVTYLSEIEEIDFTEITDTTLSLDSRSSIKSNSLSLGEDSIEDGVLTLAAYTEDEKTQAITAVKALLSSGYKYSDIIVADETIQKYLKITGTSDPILYDLTEVDEYRTQESTVGTNEILIVDKKRTPYDSIPESQTCKNEKREMIGIVPVITTAANALYAQNLLAATKDDAYTYESISKIKTLKTDDIASNIIDASLSSVVSKAIANLDCYEEYQDSLALEAASYFPAISTGADGIHYDRENMKKIGVVVFKAFLDSSEGNKISFQIVESFCGSLDKNGKNPNTGATTFIDTLVNEQSEYINLFSNCFNTTAIRKIYEEDVDILIAPADDNVAPSFGFYSSMCVENISYSESILQALETCYTKVEDINERDIDIVVDAGIANIAQYISSVFGGTEGQYDPTSEEAALWKCKKANDTKAWKTVIQKYNNFCKNVRKDCMFICDGPRPYCLVGNKKIVRPSKPTNTIDANILPYTKYLTGINTNYGAGYCDWFEVTDEFSGQTFWCPPSIKAAGVYIYTDCYFEYWDAPAGLNRGMVSALDVAFSPTSKQAGEIYQKNWNYAINYPADGIILEGQKTLQVAPSCFDRVNVRRLFLRLERQTYKTARYFVYEGNTAYTRQRFVDTINPIFATAKSNGGVYDYKIICDTSNNTDDVIDNNEMRVKIGIKPVKTAEFILIDFVALSTGGSWSEL